MIGDIRFARSLNPELDEYSAEVELGGRRVEVDLYSDAELEIASTIAVVRKILAEYPSICEKAKTYLERHVIPEWAEAWRADQPRWLDATILADHLKLDFITAHADGRATFWYTAGEVFTGHGLQLFMDRNGAFVDYDTPG